MSELKPNKTEKSTQIKEKLAKLPNRTEIESNVSATNQKIAERNGFKSNLLVIQSFLEDQEQTPEIKKKLVKINLQIQKLELEIATNRAERVDLGDEIVEVANKEKVEKPQNSAQSQIQANNPKNERSEKSTKLDNPLETSEKRQKIINLSSWFNPNHVQEGWLNLPREIPLEEIKNYLDDQYKKTQPPTPQQMQKIAIQREEYRRLGLDYETAPTTLTELISLLQITITNLGGNSFDNNSNLEYWSAEKDKLIKIEVIGDSFGIILMEFVKSNSNYDNQSLHNIKTRFLKEQEYFRKKYYPKYPITDNLFPQNNSDKIPTSFILFASSNDSQSIGYYDCFCTKYGCAHITQSMSDDNNSFEIREIYKKIHALFGERFGVQKLEDQKK